MGESEVRNSKVSATTVVILMGMMACGCLVSAGEEGEPLIITKPASDTLPISCAVYFSDNMVYAPQWRIDNYVRIETMVIDMTGYTSPTDIARTDIDLYPSEVYADGLAQQKAILENPTVLDQTKMVSVSYIEITMRNSGGIVVDSYESGWAPVSLELVIGGGVMREVNKAGHLIYGMLWDTTGRDSDVYAIEVTLGRVVEVNGVWEPMPGEWYSIDYAIANWYDPEAPEEGTLMNPENPFHALVEADDPDYQTYGIGVGGLRGQAAWIDLGPLIPQGPGGGSGGDGGSHGADGDGDGDGNHHCNGQTRSK